jgi:hypothetical protein
MPTHTTQRYSKCEEESYKQSRLGVGWWLVHCSTLEIPGKYAEVADVYKSV